MKATKEQLLTFCVRHDACEPGLTWVRAQAGSAQDIWNTFDNQQWMLWLAGRCEVSQTSLVLIACDAAQNVAHLNTDPRVQAAINAAKAWAQNPNQKNKNAAADAAYAADAAARAADAAAYAAVDAAAYAAARAAARAADAAAYAAADAAYAADAADAATCTSIRTHITWSEIESALLEF